MNGLILEGGKEEKDAYIDELIKKHGIPSYNINVYEEQVKIADIREIIRRISLTTDLPRIFIFRQDITLDSQNALLKMLEELAEDTFVVFAGTEALLPTIYSRCKTVTLKNDFIAPDDADFAKLLAALDKKDFGNALLLIDKTLSASGADGFVIGLRKVLIEAIMHGESHPLAARFLSRIVKERPLLKNNNLNERLLFEKMLVQIMENTDKPDKLTT